MWPDSATETVLRLSEGPGSPWVRWDGYPQLVQVCSGMRSLDSAGRVWFPCPSWAFTSKIHDGVIPPVLLELIMSFNRETEACPSLYCSSPHQQQDHFVWLWGPRVHKEWKALSIEWLTSQTWADRGTWVQNPGSSFTSHVFTRRLLFFLSFHFLSVKRNQQ